MSGRDVTVGEVAAYELGVETGRAELQQRVRDLEAYLLDPNFIEFMRSKVGDPPAKPAGTPAKGGEPEWDKLSPAELATALLAEVNKLIQNAVQPVKAESAVRAAQAQVKEAEGKYPDFWQYKTEMVELAQKNPTLSVDDCYKLAKARMVKRPAAPKPPVASEAPTGAPGRRANPAAKGIKSNFDQVWNKVVGDSETI